VKSLALALATLCLAGAARAHEGSPNVFFEGRAGAHPLRIVIRPPQTFPGLAQADIRIADSDVTGVSVQAQFLDAGADTVPPPTPATR